MWHRRKAALITSARVGHTQDIGDRRRRYAITQGIRIACFITAALVPAPVVVKLVLIVGAMVLPMIGVISANGGPVVRTERPSFTEPEPVRAIEPGAGRVIDADPR